MLSPQEKSVLDHLGKFISDHKKEVLAKVLDSRTRYVTVVLEDIYQPQNASAAIRTCECMGIQDIHLVENLSQYSINPRVLCGSNKWIDLIRYKSKSVDTTQQCLHRLRELGYSILAADPSEDGLPVHDVDISGGKVALWFGNELRGISDQVLKRADARVRIPMYGFTESLNISVSVAICLSVMVTKLHALDRNDWQLPSTEKDMLRLKWYRKMVRKSSLIEREFLRSID
jgi:tRNA (guanosine-2'-O-)-methyltransferase